MNRPIVLVAAGLLLAMPLAGCIENMQDLKSRISGGSVQPAACNPCTPPTPTPTVNDTRPPLLPPVARMAAFAQSGALLYKASFVAENMTTGVVMVDPPGNVTFVSSDSEAVNKGAELVKFSWTVDGKSVGDTRRVTVPMSTPGLYMVILTVTDSLGAQDAQMVHYGVAPRPFVVQSNFTGGPEASVPGQDAQQFTFTVLSQSKEGKPLVAQNVEVVLHGGDAADLVLLVKDPAGHETKVDDGFVQDGEKFTTPTGTPGTWTITVKALTGATTQVSGTVKVTYVEVIPGLGEGAPHHH